MVLEQKGRIFFKIHLRHRAASAAWCGGPEGQNTAEPQPRSSFKRICEGPAPRRTWRSLILWSGMWNLDAELDFWIKFSRSWAMFSEHANICLDFFKKWEPNNPIANSSNILVGFWSMRERSYQLRLTELGELG